MIDFQCLFHIGIRVADLDAAMAELGSSLALTWSSCCAWEQPVWTPADGLGSYPLRFTYSTDGPVHVELLEGAPGSPWHAGDAPGTHHVGVWVDDVAAAAHTLVADGWRLVAASAEPDAGFGGFAYLAPPNGLLVEVVASRMQPRFEAWWAGGSLG